MSSAASAAGHGAFRSELDALVEQRVQEDRMIERILADQERRHVVGDDDERRQPALHRRRFAEAECAILRLDPHECASGSLCASAPLKLKGVHFADLHATSSRECLCRSSASGDPRTASLPAETSGTGSPAATPTARRDRSSFGCRGASAVSQRNAAMRATAASGLSHDVSTCPQTASQSDLNPRAALPKLRQTTRT